jgi:hypothetical protein
MEDTRIIKDDNTRIALAGFALGFFLFILFTWVRG